MEIQAYPRTPAALVTATVLIAALWAAGAVAETPV